MTPTDDRSIALLRDSERMDQPTFRIVSAVARSSVYARLKHLLLPSYVTLLLLRVAFSWAEDEDRRGGTVMKKHVCQASRKGDARGLVDNQCSMFVFPVHLEFWA